MLWSRCGWLRVSLLFLAACRADPAHSGAACPGARCTGDDATEGDDQGIEIGDGVPEFADPGTVDSEPDDEAAHIFDQDELHTYNLVIDPKELAKIDKDPAAEQYVEASLQFEGKIYGPLGVRYKGSVGSFLSPCTSAVGIGQKPGAKVGKCSIKIDFDHIDADARFYGLKKLNFHSMGLDRSQLRDRLGYALFREMGVAASRAVHARLLINAKLEGLFVVVEQVDGRFTRSRFTEGGEGNLYKEVWPTYDDDAEYLKALETNEAKADVAKMLAFKRAVDSGPDAIADWIDRDYMLRYLAVDRLIINDDGALHWYCTTRDDMLDVSNHNFYWYEAEQARRMWLVPWDLDNTFGGNAYVHISPAWNVPADCTCSGRPAARLGSDRSGNSSQRPAACDPLTAAWAQWDSDFQTMVASFLGGPFSAANIDAKLTAWSQQIDAATKEASGLNGAPSYSTWKNTTVPAFRDTIDDARMYHGYQYR